MVSSIITFTALTGAVATQLERHHAKHHHADPVHVEREPEEDRPTEAEMTSDDHVDVSGAVLETSDGPAEPVEEKHDDEKEDKAESFAEEGAALEEEEHKAKHGHKHKKGPKIHHDAPKKNNKHHKTEQEVETPTEDEETNDESNDESSEIETENAAALEEHEQEHQGHLHKHKAHSHHKKDKETTKKAHKESTPEVKNVDDVPTPDDTEVEKDEETTENTDEKAEKEDSGALEKPETTETETTEHPDTEEDAAALEEEETPKVHHKKVKRHGRVTEDPDYEDESSAATETSEEDADDTSAMEVTAQGKIQPTTGMGASGKVSSLMETAGRDGKKDKKNKKDNDGEDSGNADDEEDSSSKKNQKKNKDDENQEGSEGDKNAPKEGEEGAETQADKDKDKESAGSCFAGDAQVMLTSGPTTMSTLRIGDMVKTATGFEPVVGFLHAEEGEAEFIEISNGAGVLPITPDHLVFLANGDAVPASVIRVGDNLSSGVVTDVKQVIRTTGIYAPLTNSGTIEVEGAMASTYSTVVSTFFEKYHSVAHLMMAPMRWAGISATSPTVAPKMAFTTSS